MMKAYRFRIQPSPAVRQKLERTLDLCRELYNGSLQERRDAYRMAGCSLNYHDQSAELPEVKRVRPDVAEVYSQVLQDVLQRVHKAFDGFFRRVKTGTKAGYPRFKPKSRYDSFTYPGTGWSLKDDRLTLSKIGTVRLRLSRPLAGTVKTVQVKREGTRWYAIFTCEPAEGGTAAQCAARAPGAVNVVGIDVGIESFLTTSEGKHIANPKHYRQAEARLKRVQRRLSRKKRGSRNRNRQRERVAKLHRKTANQRKDFLHKLSRKLVNRYDLICFEDLHIKGMVKNHHLAKSITDAGWGMFLNMVVYKAGNAGKRAVNVNPNGTSQECSGCHEKVPKGLSVRWHTCPHCQTELHRDHNAARNILARGINLWLAAGLAVTVPGGLALAGPVKGEPGNPT